MLESWLLEEIIGRLFIFFHFRLCFDNADNLYVIICSNKVLILKSDSLCHYLGGFGLVKYSFQIVYFLFQ